MDVGKRAGKQKVLRTGPDLSPHQKVFVLFLGKVSCSPGWPSSRYIAEVGFELPIPLPPPHKSWNQRSVPRWLL